MTTTTLALMPDFMDPVTLIGYFGTIEKKEIVGRVFVRIWPLNRLDLL